jgi:hypothetical protein
VALPVVGVGVGVTQIVRGVANTPEAIREQQRGKHWDMVGYLCLLYNAMKICTDCQAAHRAQHTASQYTLAAPSVRESAAGHAAVAGLSILRGQSSVFVMAGHVCEQVEHSPLQDTRRCVEKSLKRQSTDCATA